MQLSRQRSHSTPRPRSQYYYDLDENFEDDDVAAEADYYARINAERASIGEAWNGATRDWTIVDVPPGTRRVRMDGAGGGSQEISWQRYNGVRRSRFHPEAGNDGPRGTQTRQSSDMWTELTKDLVTRKALDAFGYEYEETEFFFYVTDYLRYVRHP